MSKDKLKILDGQGILLVTQQHGQVFQMLMIFQNHKVKSEENFIGINKIHILLSEKLSENQIIFSFSAQGFHELEKPLTKSSRYPRQHFFYTSHTSSLFFSLIITRKRHTRRERVKVKLQWLL